MIREWRQRRHLSQLELANRAEVSTRHLSYIENGRSRPTSAMVMRLCDHLEVPLREQNELLLAAGHAPAHPEHSLADPPMAEANAALEAILQAHGPYPALVVDRHWELVDANREARRIEATDTTFWFGFKDDIVIRLTPEGEFTRVDMRSVSRVGRSDVGTNARRIREFLESLQAG